MRTTRRTPALLAISILLALAAMLSLIGAVPAQATVDYDTDDDGYIEVSGHAQLNAIRYDLDSDGSPASAGATAYGAAFPNRDTNAATRMGCPSGVCVGYELIANIDLDTDVDGGADSGDAYWNRGSGWLPIGADNNRYTGDFKGNRFTIDNLFISRPTTGNQGLFGGVGPTARIESVGVTNANVTGGGLSGILVGSSHGSTIVACYTTGSVTGTNVVGGLVGWTNSAISTSYSTASVTGDQRVGGLLGASQGGSITNSYSTGSVTRSKGTAIFIGGLIGYGAGATASYWNTTTSGQTTSFGGAGVVGKTTTELQSPTDYTGIYASWNIDLNDIDGDVDAATGADYPWNFGTSSQYPTLQYGAPGDYDIDNDNYIDVASLAQLNAIRYDLDGNGAQDTVSASDWTSYTAAFPDGATGMGCASTCVGYELFGSLDFDSDGDAYVDASDHGGAYWDNGAGWTPIGRDTVSAASRYSGDFKGNGYVIHNLFINRSGSNDIGLFGAIHITSRIESIGVTNAKVSGRRYAGILAGSNYGEVVACYTTGAVTGTKTSTGGLVGWSKGTISTSYSTASVSGMSEVGGLVGFVHSGGSITNSYSTGSVSGTESAIGGLIGFATAGVNPATASYWNTTTSGQSTSAGGSGAVGYTTADLQSPTGYTGIYSAWNANIDGNDDPWHFGAPSEYPLLKYDGMSAAPQGGQAMGVPDNWNANIYSNDALWNFGNVMQYPLLKYDGMSAAPQGGQAMGVPDDRNSNIVDESLGVCLTTDGFLGIVSRQTYYEGQG